VSELPQILGELQDLIGTAATLKLVEMFGGTRVFVPANVTAQTGLAHLVGLDNARKLAAVYAGTRLSIPRYRTWLCAARNGEVRQRHRGGETVAQLARAFDLTERHIWNILAAGEPECSEPPDAA
jgi:hypothetical protein